MPYRRWIRHNLKSLYCNILICLYFDSAENVFLIDFILAIDGINLEARGHSDSNNVGVYCHGFFAATQIHSLSILTG
jgi:hypothetical protein